jgi:hypothetical protein
MNEKDNNLVLARKKKRKKKELNRDVFSLFRKSEAKPEFLRMSGRLFQSFGAALLNALVPDSFFVGVFNWGKTKSRLGIRAQAHDGSYAGTFYCRWSLAILYMQE